MADDESRPLTARAAERRLRALADPVRARLLRGYFKTGKGEYAEGDRFLGLRVPQVRAVAREFEGLPLDECVGLLQSPWHEARLMALLVLVRCYERGDARQKKAVYELYAGHTRLVNNWDLVDLSAPRIAGAHLLERSQAPLDRWARSANVWERRIAVLATAAFIGAGDVTPTLRLARRLLADPHDLIHKAVGWMLREAAKRDRPATERFLRAHQRRMPRTMLRYAIERFPAAARRTYLLGTA
jgi:3-methyladenine DNA glycosylase AlkD